jgi:ribosomal protein S18 acetylase RimI-like enzyme
MEYRDFGAQHMDDVLQLYRDAGWAAYLRDDAALYRALENSLCLTGAFADGRLVGLVRCVGDGEHIVYVQDLIVHSQYRRRGIGSALLKNAMARFAHVRMFTLITDAQDDDANAFYRALGFKAYAAGGLAGYYR